MTNPPTAAGADVVLRRARLGLTDRIVTVVVAAGRIAHLGADEVGQAAGDGVETLDLDGRTVLPGLWDHHVHMDQWSLRRQWVDLTAATEPGEVVAAVRARLAAGPPTAGTPLVGYGFREALWPEAPHRRHLDAVSTDVPLVMVSGDLHQAWVNAVTLARYGLPTDGDGLLREHEWFRHVDDLRTVTAEVMDGWVEEAARAAAARGVVGIIDYESADNLTAWTRRHAHSPLPLRVVVAAWPDQLEAAIGAGLRTGDVVPGTDGLVTMGHLKVITDGSLNTRTAYCHDPYPGEPGNYGLLGVPPAQLVPLMRRAHGAGLGCSIHAIGDRANALALDAFATVGAVGSVEHAQLLTAADLGRFAALGVAASVQPEHAHDDRDVADRFWATRTGRSFPYGALHRSGARLLLGSDAPVAPLDPLLTVGAAISRSRDGRDPWHPEHELPLAVALAASTAHGRTEPAVGDPADLVVTDLDVATSTAERLRCAPVAATMLAGRWTHRGGV